MLAAALDPQALQFTHAGPPLGQCAHTRSEEQGMQQVRPAWLWSIHTGMQFMPGETNSRTSQGSQSAKAAELGSKKSSGLHHPAPSV